MKCTCKTEEPRESKIIMRDITSPEFNEEDQEYKVMVHYDIACKECGGIIERALDVFEFQEISIACEFIDEINKRKPTIEEICEIYTEMIGKN